MGRAFEYRKTTKMKKMGKYVRVFPKLVRAIEVERKKNWCS